MITIELLTNPGCRHAPAARQLLDRCLADLGLALPVREQVGEFASPTVLVNGLDVMGTPQSGGSYCRLDPPTRERVLSALRAIQA